jgi:hypothetical protein
MRRATGILWVGVGKRQQNTGVPHPLSRFGRQSRHRFPRECRGFRRRRERLETDGCRPRSAGIVPRRQIRSRRRAARRSAVASHRAVARGWNCGASPIAARGDGRTSAPRGERIVATREDRAERCALTVASGRGVVTRSAKKSNLLLTKRYEFARLMWKSCCIYHQLSYKGRLIKAVTTIRFDVEYKECSRQNAPGRGVVLVVRASVIRGPWALATRRLELASTPFFGGRTVAKKKAAKKKASPKKKKKASKKKK